MSTYALDFALWKESTVKTLFSRLTVPLYNDRFEDVNAIGLYDGDWDLAEPCEEGVRADNIVPDTYTPVFVVIYLHDLHRVPILCNMCWHPCKQTRDRNRHKKRHHNGDDVIRYFYRVYRRYLLHSPECLSFVTISLFEDWKYSSYLAYSRTTKSRILFGVLIEGNEWWLNMAWKPDELCAWITIEFKCSAEQTFKLTFLKNLLLIVIEIGSIEIQTLWTKSAIIYNFFWLYTYIPSKCHQIPYLS